MMYITEIKHRREVSEHFPVQSFRSRSIARRKQRNRILLQRLALVAFLVSAAILGICLLAPSSNAKAESNVSYEERIVSVRVAKNDSLWKIAERFYCSEKESIRQFVNDIKEMNHLEGDTIYPDTYLVVRYYVKN